LNHPLSIITGNNHSGGLEGCYAFTIIEPWIVDFHGFFNMVVAHEAVHCWIGVRVGEHEDGWWKEGTTNYLGYQLAFRRGLCSRWLVEQTLLADLSKDLSVMQIPLSDALVRVGLYDTTMGMLGLVYTKGAQVSMLIDERLRRQSGGRSSIEGLCSYVVGQLDGGAFDRAAYLELVKRYSGIEIGDIYAQWVDSAGVIPNTLLASSWVSLLSMGAFGQQPLVAASAGDGAKALKSRVRRW
jgi:predicted metalloprotease with PDZ domain